MPLSLAQARQHVLNRKNNIVNQPVKQNNVTEENEKPENSGGFFGGVGYTLGKFGTSILRNLESKWDYIAGGIADLFGADEWAQEQMENSPFDEWNEQLDAWYNPSGFMSFVGDTAGVLGGMLPDIALNFIPGVGGALSTAGFITSAAGQGVSDAAKTTGELGAKEWLYGTASGAVEGAIEKASGGIGGTQLGTVLGKQVAKSTAGKVASTFVGEGLEEVASDLIDPVLRRATGVDPEATVDVAQLPNTFLVGGTAGAILGGGSRLVNAARSGGFNNLNAREDLATIREAQSKGNSLQSQGKLNEKWEKTLSEKQTEAEQRLSSRLQKMDTDARQKFISDNNLGSVFDTEGNIRTVAEGYTAPKYNADAVSFSAREDVNRGTLQYAPTQNEVRSDIKTAIDDVVKLSEGNGKFVVVDTITNDSGQKVNGFYDRSTGVTYIANDGDANGVKSFVVAHEYTHQLEGSNAYSKYAKNILDTISSDESLSQKYNIALYEEAYRKAHPDYTNETIAYIARTEIVADFTAKEILSNEDTVRRLANRNRSLVVRVYEWVKDKIKTLRSNGGSKENIAFMRKAEKLLARALNVPTGGVNLNAIDEEVRKEKEDSAKAKEEAADKVNFTSSVDNNTEFVYNNSRFSLRHRAQYISYDRIGKDNIEVIRRKLQTIYSGVDNAVADSIAIEVGTTVYIVDSGKEQGEISFGVRKRIKIPDESLRKNYIWRKNNDAVSNGYISDGLSSKFKSELDKYRRSDTGRISGTELSVNTTESEYQQGGVSERDGDRRGRGLNSRFSISIGDQTVGSKGKYEFDTDSLKVVEEISNQNDITNFLPSGLDKDFINAIRSYGGFAYPRLYRGMESAELEGIKKNGYIKSNSSYNFSNQQGETFFSHQIRTSLSYATGFAPAGIREKFFEQEKPAYIVEVGNYADLDFKNDGSESSTKKEVDIKYITRIIELHYNKAENKVYAKDVYIDGMNNAKGEAIHGVPTFMKDKTTGTILYAIQDSDGFENGTYISEKNPDFIIDYSKLKDAPKYEFDFRTETAKISGKESDLVPYKQADEKRFSISVDSEGNTLSERQQEYFKNSKVRDENGNLLSLYHGSNAYEEIHVFKRGKNGYLGGGIYLTDNENYAKRYADKNGYKGRIYNVYANAENPLVVTSETPAKEILRTIYGSDSVYNRRAAKQAYETQLISSADIKKLREKGYDAIVWKYGGSTEVSVFDANQIKLTSNKTPTNNPDVRYSLSAIDDYTEKQYNDFGWARVNDVLSVNEYTDFNNKLNNLTAEIKRRRTADGEYIIAVNDLQGDRFGINNVLVFAKGTYQNPKIIRVIRINLDNETSIEIIRSDIYEWEKRNSILAGEIISRVYGEELVRQYTAGTFQNYREIQNEWWRRSGGGESGRIDGVDREVQNRRGDSQSNRGDVRFSLSQNQNSRDENYVNNKLKTYTYADVESIVDNLTINKYGDDVVLRGKKNVGKQIYTLLNETPIRNRRAKAEQIARQIVYQNLAAQSLYNAEEIENARRDGIEISETWIDKKLSSQISETENESLVSEIRDELLNSFETTGKLNDAGKMYLRYKDVGDRLSKLLVKDSIVKTARRMKKRNYPKAFEGFDGIRKILSKLEMRSDINQTSGRDIIKAFGEFYTASNEALQGYYSEEVRQAIDDFISYNGQGNLDLYELEQIDTILNAADYLLKEYDKAFLNGRTVSVTDTSNKAVNTVKENADLYRATVFGAMRLKGYVGRFFRSIVDTRTLAMWLDGGDKGIITELFEDIAKGSTKQTITVMELYDDFDKFIKKNKKFYKSLEEKITFKFNGKDVEITRGEAISLYLTSLQEDGLYHLAFGGFAVGKDQNNIRKYVGQKPLYGKPEDVEQYEAEVLQKAKKEFTALFDTFSETEKEYISLAKNLFNNKAKRIKQEIDIQRIGMTNANVENYFPERVYEVGRPLKQGNTYIQEMNLIANQSIHKDRVKGSKQTLYISPVNMVIMNHIRQIAMYNAYAIPVDTLRRVMNKNVSLTFDGRPNTAQVETLKTVIQENAWSDFEKFLDKYMMDVQGGSFSNTTPDKIIRWMRSNYAKFQLGLNIKTMLSQLTSLPMAGSRLGWGNLLKGTFAKPNFDEMLKFSEWARARNYEGAAYKSQSLVDNVDKVGQLAMKPIGMVDLFTMNRIYNAAKYYIASRDGISLDSVECKTKAAAMLEEIGRETQNNSEAAEKSAIMRSDNELIKSIVMFSSDAMKQFSTLIQALNRIKFIKQKIKLGKGDKAVLEKQLSAARKEARGAFASVGTSAAMYVLMGMLVNYGLFAKEPEDDESYIEIFLKNFGGSVTGMIPVVRDLYSFFVEGYELDNFAYETINGLSEAVKNLGTLMERAGSGERVTDQEWMLAMRKFIYAAGQITGIPTRNLYNQIYGLIKRVSPSAAYDINSMFYGASTKDLDKAIEKGDTALSTTIAEQLLSDKGIDASKKVASAFSDLYSKGYSMPKGIPESITYNEEEISLNAKQQGIVIDAYSEAANKAEGLINSADWASLSDDAKANALKLLFNYYYYYGINKATGAYADNRTLLLGSAIDITKIASAYGQIAELTADTDKKGNVISGTKKAKVQRLVNSLRLSAAQKYILMGFLGYKNVNGESTVHTYVRSLGLTGEMQLSLLEMCGYDATKK